MTKKPNKFARKAATQIEIGKKTIRTSPYLGKRESDHIRFMVEACEQQKDDPEAPSKEYLDTFKNFGFRSAQAAALKAKGLI
jgi:hypothetical protein